MGEVSGPRTRAIKPAISGINIDEVIDEKYKLLGELGKGGDVSIFHAGDSSYVDMKKFPSDLVFLPTGNPSPTASPAKAMQMAADLKPQIAVTVHGSDGQNQEFTELMKEKMPKTKVMSPAQRTLKRVHIK